MSATCRITQTDLAISGGRPVRVEAFAPWPSLPEEAIEAAAAVLRSGKINYWTGEEGREFEREFAAFTACRHAVALANGTVALEIALQACGIGPGDDVVVTSRTFVASASCAVMRGARPVMADVDRDSQNMTAETIRWALTPRTTAIIAVHLAGWPCDMDPIMELARERGLKVVEDCAQALGATYKGRPVGSIGDVGAFSFCQDKVMTTGGEGGMLTTNQAEIWDRAWSFKDHGKSYDAVYRRDHGPGFRWLHESFGSNARMTEMQSAIGRVCLPRVPEYVEKRRRLAACLSAGLAAIPGLRVPGPAPKFGHAYYKFYAFLRPQSLREGWTRDRVQAAIEAEGVPCFSGSCSEIYLEKAFPEDWRPVPRLAVARELGETSLMFLVHPTLCEQDMADTCTAVNKVMAVAVKESCES